MYLDRDFLRTPEGFLFCVVGCVHPRDRVIAYLKYVPNENGRWGRGDARYHRTMPVYSVPALLGNIDDLRSNFHQYVFRSKVMGIQMSAVPRRYITYHYQPSVRLKELLSSRSNDELEEKAVKLVQSLSEASGVDQGSFGISGSILLGIHNPAFSDLDIVVYGHDNAVSVKNALRRLFTEGRSPIMPLSGRTLKDVEQRWTQRYLLSQIQTQWFAARRWNRGLLMGSGFSILPVRLPHEINERYGETYYRSEGIVAGTAQIADAEDSCFLPSTYTLKDAEPATPLAQVRHLVSYDSFHSGVFESRDRISFHGKLEKCISRGGDELYQRVVIGSPEASGLDYLLPLLS